MKHLDLNEGEAYYWVDYIAKFTFREDPLTFDLKRDVENLDRALKKVLATLKFSAMTQAARDTLSFRMIWGPHTEELIARSGQKLETFSKDFLSYSENIGRKARDSLQALEDNISTIQGSIRSTKSHIEKSVRAKKSTGRINFKGI